MKVLFLTGRETSYPRNDVILRAFRRFSDVDVIPVRRRPSSLLINSISVLLKSVAQLSRGEYDLIFVGFYGTLIAPILGKCSKVPMLFDAFISTYDTLITDRKIGTNTSLLAKSAMWLDKNSVKYANRVLLDTRLQVDYFVNKFGLPTGKLQSLPVGCNEDIFSPRPYKIRSKNLKVLYYTSYQPLHGVDVVVQAAEILRTHPVQFRIIGRGMTYNNVLKQAERLQLNNTEFAEPVLVRQLPEEISTADICLGGHFGLSEKGGRVIPGKIYQILAMGWPLIATSTPANLALLTHGENALLCPPNQPQALAEAIIRLIEDGDERKRIGSAGYQLYMEACSEDKITGELKSLAKGMLN
jgi:glycosyltransferase involved in cell wall biosynthesis